MDKQRKSVNMQVHQEKKHQLYLQQKELLDTFLEKKAITQKQYDKSFNDLTKLMGEDPEQFK